jgi:hypothetical protein
MKVNPRSRIVTFRVTEREYQSIKSMCDGTTNCVSEVAREAVVGNRGLKRSRLDYCLACIDDKLDRVVRLLNKTNEFPEA